MAKQLAERGDEVEHTYVDLGLSLGNTALAFGLSGNAGEVAIQRLLESRGVARRDLRTAASLRGNVFRMEAALNWYDETRSYKQVRERYGISSGVLHWWI